MGGQNLRLAIDDGLRAIEELQRRDGGFISYSSPVGEPFRLDVAYQTVFGPALILSALVGIDRPGVGDIRSRLARYLQLQRGSGGSFNYWARDSREYASQPYPDDLDDTACALIGLCRDDPSLLTGELLAEVAQLLIGVEERPGGPYRTWLMNEGGAAWRDVDLAVNANIGRWLALAGVELPSIVELVEEGITGERLTSPYYPTPLPLIYFLSFWYRGACRQMLVEMAERALTAALADRSALNIALSVTSLLHFGTPPGELAEAVEELLHLQTAEGWPPEGFCIDPSQHGRPYVAGSAALTTAVCLEALWGYYRATTGAGEVEEASKVSAGTSGQAKESWDEVEGLVKGLPGLIGADALAWCRRLRQQDRDGQIVQLPWLMADVVKGGREVPAKLLRQLAVANAVGWMAYTIQDDVIDGDLPVSAIPGVGVLMRLVRQRFALVLPRDVGFQRLADEVLIGMDEVSRWELERCRLRTPGRLPRHLPDFGDYRRLANRSAGHILGAAGVLAAAGWPVDGQENQQLQQAWRHILIARQLNDDAHDWEEDWRRGRINAVTVLVVGDVRATAKGTIRVRPDLDDLRLQFWQQTIDTVAALIHEHCRLARELLQHNPALASTAALAQLLEPLEQAANRALAGRGQAQMFVDRFKGQS